MAPTGGDSGSEDAVVAAAVRRVVGHGDFASKFKHPVRFDGTDFVEKRLSPEEQLAEVSKLASSKIHVFLERYGALLQSEDLCALGACPAAATAEARFWIERLQRAPPSAAQRQKRNRRRRWSWARREMARSDGFFCEDDMKRRDPRLFHRLVGRYMDSGMRLSAPMQGSLSGYLMQQLEKESLREATGATAAGAQDADGSTSSTTAPTTGVAAAGAVAAGAAAGAADGDDEEGADGASLPSEEEGEAQSGGATTGEGGAPDDAAVRRAKFLKAMRDRFINGAEPGFDYTVVDADSELDDVAELGRDAEEKYFDDE